MSNLLGYRRLFAACLAVLLIAAPASAQLRSTVYVSGLSNPVAFVQDPSNATLQYVVEQGGRIKVVQNGTVLPTLFLNISTLVSGGSEQGLLGLAFPPNYGSSGRFYVCFTNTAGNIVVSRFRRSPAIRSSPTRHPDSTSSGPTASGSSSIRSRTTTAATWRSGLTDTSTSAWVTAGAATIPIIARRTRQPAGKDAADRRLGSTATPRATPCHRPTRSSGGRATSAEIWSFGLRNPWRWSFDDPAHGGTGAMVIGDVGQSAREEIDYEPAGRGGRNYGWRNREGTLDNITDRPPAFLPLTDPIFDYGRSDGQVVTGGFVYRGSALGAAYRGRYFFADFGSRRVWSLALSINPVDR